MADQNPQSPEEPTLTLDGCTLKPAPRIPTTEYIRPCDRIEPETKEFVGVATIAERYSSLTSLLPLAGAEALKPNGRGELAITAYLRSHAPWDRSRRTTRLALPVSGSTILGECH